MSGRFLDERNTPGDPITAALFNRIRSEIRRNRVVLPNAQQLGGPGGLRVLASGSPGVRLCRTKTTISGRSGTTPGSGTVYLVVRDDTELVTRTDDEIEVFNGSEDAEAENKYGTILWIAGDWWFYPLDC